MATTLSAFRPEDGYRGAPEGAAELLIAAEQRPGRPQALLACDCGRAGGWVAGRHGSALARRVPLRVGRNARPVSSGPSGPTRVKLEPPQPPVAAWPSQMAGVAARRNELDAGRFGPGGIPAG
jgi:hypothetical protein